MAVDRYRVHLLYCPIAEQYYSAVEEIHGTQGMIVSFALESAPSGRVMVRPGVRLTLPVSPRLRGCMICRCRTSCSCECLHSHIQCEKNVGYRFQCLYCRQLQSVTAAGNC